MAIDSSAGFSRLRQKAYCCILEIFGTAVPPNSRPKILGSNRAFFRLDVFSLIVEGSKIYERTGSPKVKAKCQLANAWIDTRIAAFDKGRSGV